MNIGWFKDMDDADKYFEEERLETEAWDNLEEESGGLLKSKVIKNAYNRLYHNPKWELPTFDEATDAELVKLRIVNAEMAYYLAMHLADEDRRKGLQAQAVEHAGIVKEIYSEDKLNDLPIPPIVEAMLEEWAVDPGHAGILDLARDEEESVKTKVHDF